MAAKELAPWETEPPPKPAASRPTRGIGETALEHAGNGIALGYLPQLQALTQKPIYAALNAVTGNDVKPDDYLTARDKNIRRLQEEQQDNPKTALASEVTGGLLGAAATPLPEIGMLKGAGIMKGAAKGGLIGAGYGIASNPGDTEGKINPVQAIDRLKNAGKGSLVGGVAGGVTGGVSNALQGSKGVAEEQAFKAAGGMLKDFRSQDVNSLGRYALDNGLVSLGDDFKSVAAKTEGARDAAGSKLDNIYSKAVERAKAAPADINEMGFNPVRDKEEIVSQVGKSMGNTEGKKSALNRLGDYLDQLAEDHGDKILDPRTTQDVKTEIRRVVNYSRNPLTKQPATERAFESAGGIVSKDLDQEIDRLGNLAGDPGAKAELKAANLDYGSSKQLSQMAEDRASRESANRIFGLTDTIAGAAGTGAGMAAGGLMGDDMYHKGVGGAAGFIGSALLNKLGRKYGPSTLASGANTAYRLGAVPAGRAIEMASPPLTRGLLSAGLNEKALDGFKKEVAPWDSAPPPKNEVDLSPLASRKPNSDKEADQQAKGSLGGGKIHVSNGKETLEIDAADEANAAKDGYKRIK